MADFSISAQRDGDGGKVQIVESSRGVGAVLVELTDAGGGGPLVWLTPAELHRLADAADAMLAGAEASS